MAIGSEAAELVDELVFGEIEVSGDGVYIGVSEADIALPAAASAAALAVVGEGRVGLGGGHANMIAQPGKARQRFPWLKETRVVQEESFLLPRGESLHFKKPSRSPELLPTPAAYHPKCKLEGASSHLQLGCPRKNTRQRSRRQTPQVAQLTCALPASQPKQRVAGATSLIRE